ncbi:hypothetical protein WHZ77_21275 [Bradyrhizobium sp. A5]|uniref:hypothetical protein n=1 Tax=Bradyrhizobium sp. A5 TaxID=3133696 RepID=UPI003246345B
MKHRLCKNEPTGKHKASRLATGRRIESKHSRAARHASVCFACKMFSAGFNGKRFEEPDRHRNRHPTMDSAPRERKLTSRRKYHEIPRLENMTVKSQAISDLFVLKNETQSIQARDAVQILEPPSTPNCQTIESNLQ